MQWPVYPDTPPMLAGLPAACAAPIWQPILRHFVLQPLPFVVSYCVQKTKQKPNAEKEMDVLVGEFL